MLPNQHFISPINTCTDVTVHFLTLVGGPTTLELFMAQWNRSFLPWNSKKAPLPNKTELLLINTVLVHVLWDPCSAPVYKGPG